MFEQPISAWKDLRWLARNPWMDLDLEWREFSTWRDREQEGRLHRNAQVYGNFLQGNEGAALLAELDACENEAQVQYLLSAYDIGE
jgi:hypothetical protein